MGWHLLRRQIISFLKLLPKTEVFRGFVLFFCLCANIVFAQNNAKKPLDIPLPLTQTVENYKAQFLSASGKKYLEQVMNRASVYRSYIKQKIAEYELPECVEFLPAIESDFVPYALSKSGALGIWQFMPNSIADFNIRSNEWIDERRDPWLTTDAALKKLKDNYTYFNDWYLALAAYNLGLGAISRIIKETGINDYWKLSELKSFRTETINYVPKFLVVADLLTNAAFYGLNTVPFDENAHQNFETLQIQTAVDLHFLAEQIPCDFEQLLFYNPALNTTLTPPDLPYLLRFPAGLTEQVKNALQNNPLQ